MAEQKSIQVARAKVAGIVGDSQLAINAGSAAGVQMGDQAILHRRVEVTDPDSGEKLGTVLFARLNLVVNHVQDRFCVAIVTDREPQKNPLQVEIRRLLKVTDSSLEEDARHVLVTIGEDITIRRNLSPDDPPF